MHIWDHSLPESKDRYRFELNRVVVARAISPIPNHSIPNKIRRVRYETHVNENQQSCDGENLRRGQYLEDSIQLSGNGSVCAFLDDIAQQRLQSLTLGRGVARENTSDSTVQTIWQCPKRESALPESRMTSLGRTIKLAEEVSIQGQLLDIVAHSLIDEMDKQRPFW